MLSKRRRSGRWTTLTFTPLNVRQLRQSVLIAARKRLESFVESRAEWCISRQRSWGVPIPILHDANGIPMRSNESVSHIISVLEEKGMEHWWTGPTEDFIAPCYKGGWYRRGNDTLDVWFDSGSSWTLLQKTALRPKSLPLADVYLEGSDQHRGWFQSSLLTCLCDTGAPPYGKLITHGFVMDEDGKKMSKSAGNGMSPMEIVHGTKVCTEVSYPLLTHHRTYPLMVPTPFVCGLHLSSIVVTCPSDRRLLHKGPKLCGSCEASHGFWWQMPRRHKMLL